MEISNLKKQKNVTESQVNGYKNTKNGKLGHFKHICKIFLLHTPIGYWDTPQKNFRWCSKILLIWSWLMLPVGYCDKIAYNKLYCYK